MTAQATDKNWGATTKGNTVFIVDDDAEISQSLESLLRSLGYQVEAFTSSQSFLDRVEEGVSGCVLLDVRIPGISGLEIQRRLAQAQQTIPIVFLTGHGDIQMAVSAMKAGAVEFLPKPFREQQLIDAVSEAMEQSVRAEEDGRIRSTYQENMTALSPKEREILDDLSSGLHIKEVACKRALSTSTVRVHRRNINFKIKSTSLSNLLILHNKYGRNT